MRRKRRINWVDPEDLGVEQARKDADYSKRYPNRKFYVYVLRTDFGHYVGHTRFMSSRMLAHRDGNVKSTSGSTVYEVVWVSPGFSTRECATKKEAQLKSLLCQGDRGASRFKEWTGLDPIPFVRGGRYVEYNPKKVDKVKKLKPKPKIITKPVNPVRLAMEVEKEKKTLWGKILEIFASDKRE